MPNSIFRALPAAALLGLVAASYVQADDDLTITVYKTPWCGCCHSWAEKVAKAGYTVRTKDLEDLSDIKHEAGVPDNMQACHTAVIGDNRKYVLEGHVPLQAIDKLMSERPDIRGIAVAGMPQGSLGMGYDETARYDVHALPLSGSAVHEVFMKMGVTE